MFNYDETMLSERDNKLIDIWSNIYNAFNSIDYEDGVWHVHGPDYEEKFSSSEAMIKMIEDDVKESLLVYALNDELSELI